MENADSRKSKKLKTSSEGMFQINEEVEVRRLEEGYLGSWHPGIVIKCGKVKCHVRYKNVLNKDGSDYLVNVVRISKASAHSRYNLRGFIRPPPPLIQRLDLKYGLCVDVNFQEAWWEGVIFDHCDGMEKRSVFSPDLCEEVQIDIHQLRITQDWNEVTGQWNERGYWVFLELLEECLNGSFINVSAKQIWFDVQQRMKCGMRGEWTYNVKDLYKDVVRDVVSHYLSLPLNQGSPVLGLPGSLLDERPEQESVEPMVNVDLNLPLSDKEILVQKEPVPLAKKVLPELQIQITLEGAPEAVSGDKCSQRRRSTANQKSKSSRNSKAKISKRQSNGLPSMEQGSSKKVARGSAPDLLALAKPLNIFSWLMDNKMIFPRSTVYYYNEKVWHHAAPSWTRGKITRNGIKCYCCDIMYNLADFEIHACGISTCRPSASIFLRDGKSLLECQIEIMQNRITRETSEKSCRDLYLPENDFVCSVCLYGGELMLCDKCPSAFHNTCLGLENIPDGDWHCPQCRCAICDQSKVDEHALTCVQCQRNYHVWCLQNGGIDISRCPENWVCGRDCERIHHGLHQLLGKPTQVGVDNLTWTLVKFIKPEYDELGGIRSDSSMAESYCKLNLALSVMHECFESLKQTLTSSDFIKDVMFNRRSDLRRLNFQGFYTVLLERNEELVCVAIVRVHGEKVAEVPLVGTRLHHRRRGFCRVLMSGLEQLLRQLGVGRLVLPAVPSTLKTWTGSFGFEKMTSLERSKFLDCTFLDFEGSIMCHKPLMAIPPPYSEPQPRTDVLPESSLNLNQPIPESEGGMLHQQTENTSTSNNEDHVIRVNVPITMEKDIPDDQRYLNGRISSEFFYGSSSSELLPGSSSLALLPGSSSSRFLPGSSSSRFLPGSSSSRFLPGSSSSRFLPGSSSSRFLPGSSSSRFLPGSSSSRFLPGSSSSRFHPGSSSSRFLP